MPRTTPILALLLFGCDADSSEPQEAPNPCESEDRDEPYVPGMAVTGEDGTVVTLQSSVPAPPTKGDNTWTVLVSDGADTPLSDLEIDVIPIMPDHGHGTPVAATVEPGDDPGTYILDPINLMMAGYWETTLEMADATGTPLDAVTFKFCVEE